MKRNILGEIPNTLLVIGLLISIFNIISICYAIKLLFF